MNLLHSFDGLETQAREVLRRGPVSGRLFIAVGGRPGGAPIWAHDSWASLQFARSCGIVDIAMTRGGRLMAPAATLVVGLIVGFALGWVSLAGTRAANRTRSDGTIRGAEASAIPSPIPVSRVSRGASEPGARTASEPPPILGDASVPPLGARERVERALRSLTLRVRTLGVTDFNDEGGPEAAANAIEPYLQGWGDALLAIDPSVIGLIGSEVSDRLCHENLSDAETLVLLRYSLRLGSRMPEIRDGLRCVLAGRVEEDVVLWHALDAWAKADLPAAPEWEDWRERAADPRTIRRLEPWHARRFSRDHGDQHAQRR